MEVVQKLDLKSSEAKEYNSEDEAHEKKGLSENSTVYLSKNTDAGLDARLLSEPPQNEGSEADQVDSFGCCSCFSFINFFKGILPMPAWNIRRNQAKMDSQVLCKSYECINFYDILEEDDFMNEANKPIKHVPRPK
ncbi:hypothetical protein Adt_02187 [Abeliophyllum distichum]|uniref:Uncharacterized protein n=1 Tax=Abeliophyllum distichum TaxID=126358 RepID=A0ABD1VUZ3_9LAMI